MNIHAGLKAIAIGMAIISCIDVFICMVNIAGPYEKWAAECIRKQRKWFIAGVVTGIVMLLVSSFFIAAL